MYLFHRTIQAASAIPRSVVGCFDCDVKSVCEEVVVQRGSTCIELLRLDASMGRFSSIQTTNLFCMIRSLTALPNSDGSRHYLVVGTDSGEAVILAFVHGKWKRCTDWEGTFGRSGLRRTVPGQFTACDPLGRAVMFAAVEQTKMVFLLDSNDASKTITMSSPLPHQKNHLLTYDICAVDVGYGNPLFAALEATSKSYSSEAGDDSETIGQMLSFYEVDLGLNHLSRKCSVQLSSSFSAGVVVPVPSKMGASATGGSGGVLVLAGTTVMHFTFDNGSCRATQCSVVSLADGDMTNDHFTGATFVMSSSVEESFFLLMTESGRMVRLSYSGRWRMQPFAFIDSCSMLVALPSGFLFASAVSSSFHSLYQITSVGESLPIIDNIHANMLRNATVGVDLSSGAVETTNSTLMSQLFLNLENLLLVDQLECNSGILDGIFLGAEIGEQQGHRHCASFLLANSNGIVDLQQGFQTVELASTPLPQAPLSVWSLPLPTSASSIRNEHSIMVVSSSNSTLLLRVLADGVQEMEASALGLLGNVRTLQMQFMHDQSMLQVYRDAMRHVRPAASANEAPIISEWRTPNNLHIVRATSNASQAAVILSDGSLVYFELSRERLVMVERAKLDLGLTSSSVPAVSCLHLPVIDGVDRLSASVLLVGMSSDLTVRVLSLEEFSMLSLLGLQAVAAAPHSIVHTMDSKTHVGLDNGVWVWMNLDSNGVFTNARSKYIGAGSVRLYESVGSMETAVTGGGGGGVIGLCQGRIWRFGGSKFEETILPLADETLPAQATSIASFHSSIIADAIVAVCNKTQTLHMLSIEHFATRISAGSQQHFSRRAILSSDEDGSSLSALSGARRIIIDGAEHTVVLCTDAGGSRMILLNDKQQMVGEPFVVDDIIKNATLMCGAMVTFYDRQGAQFLAVGVAENLCFFPRSSTSNEILLLQISPNGGGLKLMHRTPIEDIPGWMGSFAGRLLVAVGCTLRLYDAGKMRLLRKSQSMEFASAITTVVDHEWNLFVGTCQHSVSLLRYDVNGNVMRLVADDVMPRSVVRLLLLDGETVAGCDRLGSFFVLRMPPSLIEDMDQTLAMSSASRQNTSGMGQRLNESMDLLHLERVVDFFVGDLITVLAQGTLSIGGLNCIVYVTIQGLIGVFVPITSERTLRCLQKLETALRLQRQLSCLAGRDHLAFRSSVTPVKNVIDGDLCSSEFLQVSVMQRNVIASSDAVLLDVEHLCSSMNSL